MSSRLLHVLLRHALPLVLLALIIVAACRPQLTPLLRWQRDMATSGEWYRLLSAHFVHANLRHTVANALALIALWLLFGRALSQRLWLLATPICAVTISALLFTTHVEWYVGFSGVLHGLLVLALCRDRRLRSAQRALLLGAVALKIAVEQLLGSDSGDWLQIDVISDAHLFGALSGAAVAAALALRERRNGIADRRSADRPDSD